MFRPKYKRVLWRDLSVDDTLCGIVNSHGLDNLWCENITNPHCNYDMYRIIGVRRSDANILVADLFDIYGDQDDNTFVYALGECEYLVVDNSLQYDPSQQKDEEDDL